MREKKGGGGIGRWMDGLKFGFQWKFVALVNCYHCVFLNGFGDDVSQLVSIDRTNAVHLLVHDLSDFNVPNFLVSYSWYQVELLALTALVQAWFLVWFKSSSVLHQPRPNESYSWIRGGVSHKDMTDSQFHSSENTNILLQMQSVTQLFL